jgi:spermidine synthase
MGARFALAFAILLVPCTLMGATLPLLSRAVLHDSKHAARGAGLLYAVNTFGAMLGCFTAGFVLLRTIGLSRTSMVAAGLNLAVGVVAIVLGRRSTLPVAAPTPAPAGDPPRVAAACTVLAVSGFTALGYEVLWTRAHEQFVHNSTYAYSAMLVTFLFGIALGSAIAAPLAERSRRPLVALGVVEIGVALSVIAALPVYGRFGELIPAVVARVGGIGSWARVVVLIFGEAAATLLVTTFLFGMTFPLAVRLVVRDLESLGTRLGVVYTANTIGSIGGAWLVGFVALPALGVRGAFMLLVLVNLALGGTLLALAARGPWRAGVAAGTVAIAALALWIVPPGLVEASFTRQFGTLLYYREDVTDTVMVTDHDGQRMIRFGDGRGTAGTMSVREDRMYAHVPMLLHGRPERVLSICFGVGNSLAALVTYPSVERVESVELSPSVVAAAPYFAETNLNVLQNPLVNLIVSDGRNYLLTTHETFDVIRLDPPELHTAHVVNLYTREFYELARAHLRPGGIFSIWVNIVMTPEADLRSLVRTVADVFPHVSVWHGPFRYSWVINGSMESLDPDLGKLLAAYEIPSVQHDLASIGVPDAYAFLSHFVFGDEGARRFADDAPLVVDDHTRLDFTVPMSIEASYGIANANTLSWLVEFMRPERGKNLAIEIFFTKIARMWSFKEPVVPLLRHPEASGLDPDALAARIAPPASPR